MTKQGSAYGKTSTIRLNGLGIVRNRLSKLIILLNAESFDYSEVGKGSMLRRIE
jgi:hypothetical protein